MSTYPNNAVGTGEILSDPVLEHEDEKSPGVLRMEAIATVFTRFDKILLFGGLFLGAYARGLHGLMAQPFQAAAVSEWNAAGQVATLGVARATIAAASQPVWAKTMDYMGRPFVVYASTFFYCLGYILLASSQNFGQLAGGIVLQVFGFGGENIMMFIVLADVTSLRWRVLFSMIPSLHNIINIWASGAIADKFMKHATWRWGYGSGALIYPVLILPLIIALIHTTLKAKRRGLLTGIPGPWQIVRSKTYWKDFFWKADIVGLFFLIASIAMCLVPLTLGGGMASNWKTPKVLTPLVVGFVICIPAFIFWERRAKYPVVPFRLLKSRHILVSLLISALSTLTGAQQSTYLYFTLQVAFGQGVESATRISRLMNFSSVLAGIALGFAVRYVRHTKPFTIFGSALFVLAYGLLYRYRGGHSQSELSGIIGGEIVLGIASGVTQYSAQVALQAVCKHEHVGIMSSLFFACFQIGSGIGSAISGAIWMNMMPKTLLANLSAVMPRDQAAQQAKLVFGNPIGWIKTHQTGTSARMAVDESYRHLQRLLCISGIAFSAALLIASLFVDNPILDDKRCYDDKEDWSVASSKEEEAATDDASRLGTQNVKA